MKGSLEHYKDDKYIYSVVTGYKVDKKGKKQPIKRKKSIEAVGKTAKQKKENLEMQCLEFYNKVTSGNINFSKEVKTFSDYLDRFLEDGQKRWKINGYEWYERRIRCHIKPYFDKIKIEDITKRMIDDFLLSLTDKGKYIPYHCYQILHAVWNQMQYDGDVGVTANLIDRVKPPSKPTANNPIWNISQVKLFLSESRHYRYHLVYYLAFTTGCRINEILALKWSDINFDDKYITITNNVQRSGLNPLLGTPKTKRSERRIMIFDSTIDLLLAHKRKQTREIAQQQAEGEWTAYPGLEDLVFQKRTGGVVDNDYLYLKEFIPTIKRLQANKETWIPRIAIRDLRHSAATYLLDIGTPIEVISEILGHCSVEITRKHYTKDNVKRQEKYINNLTNDLLTVNCP